eukprot:1161119-Pelagomonas_calceolata.AAC.3
MVLTSAPLRAVASRLLHYQDTQQDKANSFTAYLQRAACKTKQTASRHIYKELHSAHQRPPDSSSFTASTAARYKASSFTAYLQTAAWRLPAPFESSSLTESTRPAPAAQPKGVPVSVCEGNIQKEECFHDRMDIELRNVGMAVPSPGECRYLCARGTSNKRSAFVLVWKLNGGM